MSQPVLNLQSQGSWIQVYNETRAASVAGDKVCKLEAVKISAVTNTELLCEIVTLAKMFAGKFTPNGSK